MLSMQNGNKLTYCVIIPVHNEEEFIGKTLESIINQTYLPGQVIVVNDNSSDSTAEIIKMFTEKHPFIKLVNSESSDGQHLPGSKIIEAFYKGFYHIDQEWDIISKLDADVILPPNYFYEIVKRMQQNSKVGIAGGIVYVLQNHEWIYENYTSKKHIRGAIKTYSRQCFEKIGGLKKSMGWDTADELLANYYNFEVAVFEDLIVKLLKPTGKDYKNIRYEQIGKSFNLMRYGCLIAFIAALKASYKAKNPFLFFSVSKGYLKSFLNSDSKIVTKEEGKFIRHYRLAGILKRFLNRA